MEARPDTVPEKMAFLWWPPRLDAKSVDRLSDVLKGLLAEVGETHINLRCHLVTDGLGDTDTANIGHCLESGRNVYPIPVDSITFDHHLSEVDTYPVLHPSVGINVRIPLDNRRLDLDGTLDGIGGTGEVE